MKYTVAALLCSALALSACSGSGQQGSTSTPAPAASISNPIAFPLYQNARVIATKEYTQSANAANVATSASALSEGAGTYSGHEVIAATPATFDALTTWVHGLDAKPPAGYTTAPATSLDQARAQAKKFGLDFAAFQTQESGKKVGLLVVVMDPATVTTRLVPYSI